MAYVVKPIRTFDKGIIDVVGDEKIPQSASSSSRNFLDLGDKIELVRGQLLLGDRGGAGLVSGLGTVRDVEENEYLYRKVDTNLQYYDEASDTWTTVKSDLTADEDLSFMPYRTPAGSFLWLNGQTDGPLRINAANPASVRDFYDTLKNYHGLSAIQDGRMFLWKNLGSETTLYLSYIDDDYPYTAITGESFGTGTGSQTAFSGTVAHPLVVGRSLSVVCSSPSVTLTDNGNGLITGTGGSGTINYTTGAWSITYDTAPAGAATLVAAYDYEKPATHGVADFTYSVTRIAGQGDFFPQADGSDPIQSVLPYDGKFYVFHENSIWLLDLTDDDTGATNKVYRERTGIPNWRAAVSTGEGIYYVDEGDDDKKVVRLLSYDQLSTKVIPTDKSGAVDLSSYDFSDAACVEYGDYLIWACKEGDADHNNLLLLYNKKWNLWNKMDGLYRCFSVYGGALYGGSSVDENVYRIFSGFDDDDAVIAGVWESRDWDLDVEELKKSKKLVVEGEMADSQELIVETSFDEQDWVEQGTISGTSDFIQGSSGTTYGASLYGDDTYGADDTVTAYRYMREFKLGSVKFLRAKVRFRTESYGYLSVKQFIYKDVRSKGFKLPSMFR